MAGLTAFLDASVLYPAPVRDLLLELAVSDLYRAKWSNAVHGEWIAALLRNRPDLTREQLELSQPAFLGALKTVRARLKSPPVDTAAYLHILRAQGLLATAREIEPFKSFI